MFKKTLQATHPDMMRGASAEALALPKGPKILVLPFENLSGDPQIDYIADGVTEEIMVRLSDFHLFVIASQTSWSYRDAGRAPAAIGAELGARYVLTGTVRNTSDRVRISARLVHAASGAQLWTAAYDESPSVAPNSKLVIYAAQQGGRGILAATSSDGRVKQRLVSPAADVREPAWGPLPR